MAHISAAQAIVIRQPCRGFSLGCWSHLKPCFLSNLESFSLVRNLKGDAAFQLHLRCVVACELMFATSAILPVVWWLSTLQDLCWPEAMLRRLHTTGSVT